MTATRIAVFVAGGAALGMAAAAADVSRVVLICLVLIVFAVLTKIGR